tara:strand:+ start:58919 stop:59683 length:765 start_codon:yes stop_codon:yes gene_type:complete
MKQKISILGCGWLGMPLASSLVKIGFTIKGSTTSNNKFKELISNNIKPYLITLNNLESCADFFESEILIIAIPSKNIDDFKKLILKIEQSTIKKIIFISSTSVYENLNQIVTEETETKNAPLVIIEQLFTTNNNFKTNIIRFGGLFGYNRKPGNFISFGKKIENPEGYVNLIHRDDCIKIIEEIIAKDIWNEILNACADSHPKRKNFYTKEILKLNEKAPVLNENSLNTYKIISVKKLKSILNYEFKYSDLMNY